MGFEPDARARLRRVCATTADPRLRQELSLALGDSTMFVPSTDLAREIDRCAFCDPAAGASLRRDALCAHHRSRWNEELCTARASEPADGEPAMEELMRRALGSASSGMQLLTAYQSQARALDAVWEAHRRGAIRLPESVASAVESVRRHAPGFLVGPSGSHLAGRSAASH